MFSSLTLFAQEDHLSIVHRYIAQQSWQLLKSSNPTYYENCEMKNWIGNSNTEGPWAINQERVVAGAYREDDEDVVWHSQYECPTWPLPRNHTNTHFWLVEGGPNYYHSLGTECGVNLICGGTYPNTWQRLGKYIYGGWYLRKNYAGLEPTFQKWGGGTITITAFGDIEFVYEGLVEGPRNLYQTGYMKITGYQSYYNWVTFNPPVEIRLTGLQKYFAYEILGRMSHCLADLSIPAHVHVDIHPATGWCNHPDSYEAKMEFYYTNYTSTNCGLFIDPLFQTSVHPVYYLAYTTAQITDYFPSNDFPGNMIYPNTYPYQIIGQVLSGAPFLQNIFTQYGSNGVSYENFSTIANYCMKYAIRSVAGLFYWFAAKTNQAPCYSPSNLTVSCNLTGDPVNGYNLYRGQTAILPAHVNGTCIEWNWDFNVCAGNNAGWPFDMYGLRTTHPKDINTFYLNNYQFVSTGCPIDNLRDPGGLYILAWVIASNSHGWERSNNIKILPKAIPPPSGCPYVFVRNQDTLYEPDNNILHRSELPENQGIDIRDLCKLNTVPSILNNQISLQIAEMGHDVSYFDQFKLYAVDHPAGTKIAITENNEIVMFDSVTVLYTDYADLNGEDITENVQFHEPPRGPLTSGDTLDHIYVNYFEPHPVSNAAIIMEIEGDHIILPIPVKANDHLVIGTESGDFTESFSHRENSSITVIPVNSGEEYTVINTINVDWYRNFKIRYITVASLSNTGFTTTELSLAEATHSIYGDVLGFLINKDSVYLELDTTAIISLKFSNAAMKTNPTDIRDYIIETNGRYIQAGQDGLFALPLHIVNQKINPYNYKLYVNYPNPFNPKTTIKYDIARSGLVKINVYDILGRLVTTLVNENKTPGNYSVIFDGSNLASGIYIYKLETEGFTDVKKMVLIK
jgi:hypothetical protein